MNYSDELKLSYRKSILAFAKAYPFTDEKLIIEIDNYCRTCAIYLWTFFSVPKEICTECLNVISSSDENSKVYSEDQVILIMNSLNSRKYSVRVPKFLTTIISQDKLYMTNYSRKLADCFGYIFVQFALIDNLLTAEEAKVVEELHYSLVQKCNEENVKYYKSLFDAFDFVKESNKCNNESEIGDINLTNNKITNVVEKEDKIKKTKKAVKTNSLKMNGLIGLENVKKEINEIRDFVIIQQARKENGLPVSSISYHLVFTGNPGTGKTTVARIVAKLYKDLGVVSKGQLIEVASNDLVAGYVGQTAIKTHEVIQKALGGVLFIDEAYTLYDDNGQGGYGQEAIDTLLKEMEDNRDDLAVIVAGYDDLMEKFIHSNPGLESRFNRYIHFDDYSGSEMFQIFKAQCSKNGYKTTAAADEIMKKHFENLQKNHGENFANARTVRNIFEDIISKQASRVAALENKDAEVLSTINADDLKEYCEDTHEETLEDVLQELNQLTGLENVKKSVTEFVYVMKAQQKRKALGLKNPYLSLHLVFTGNPGTGKTTVARYVAKIYKYLGFLPTEKLVEVDRSSLVAGYVGQTAIKTHEIIKKAIGGVLFIDEAYTLLADSQNDFGQEAIDTLLKEMEDNRDNLAVIVAGYDGLMDDFIHSNPGLESRFNRYIHFDDYTPDEMYKIFQSVAQSNQYSLSEEGQNLLRKYFENVNSESIGNGRGVRNLFEKIIIEQSKRLATSSTDEDVSLINCDDIKNAVGMEII